SPHPLLVEDGGEVLLVGVEGVAAGDPPGDVLAGADRLPTPRGQIEVGEAVAEAHQTIPSSAGGPSMTSPSTTSSSAASGSADSLTLASSWSTNSMASPSSSAVR